MSCGVVMKASSNCAKLMHGSEGCRLKAYRDGPGGLIGFWTIGWGSRRMPDGQPVKKGDTITQAEADMMFERDMAYYASRVEKLCPGVNQYQMDALTSITYNCGPGAPGVKKGLYEMDVRREYLAGDIAAAALAFMNHTTSRGIRYGGLVRRRYREAYLFMTGDSDAAWTRSELAKRALSLGMPKKYLLE